jgi:hypothetical protein
MDLVLAGLTVSGGRKVAEGSAHVDEDGNL